jgi:protein gp37
MNKQGKGKIEYLDFTWNVVTGCEHGCEYCYAAKIAKRFGGRWDYEKNRTLGADGGVHDLKEPLCRHTTGKNRAKPVHSEVAPYPFGFDPTFHRYRLGEPAKLKKPSIIGVVYMGDLFGEWVPDSWIEEVFKACKKIYHHQFLFLTKNPKKYSEIWRDSSEYRCNMWFGTTITDDDSFVYRGAELFQNTGHDRFKHANRFLSIEPLSGEIKEHRLRSCLHHVQWVILGQQTNPNKPPKPEWVCSIIDQCRAANVPVFVKSPLYDYEAFGLKPFAIQQWPDNLRKEV